MSCTILAIESSCDETSAAVIQNGNILSNIIATQAIHEQYGGVVPELASRAHMQNIVPVIESALTKANITKNDLNAVAFTQGPGLLGALVVGVSFAKAFALGLNIPLIGVNHMQAHILAHFIDQPQPTFPFLCLTVSGGHTQIVLVKSHLQMEVIGRTQDDAVGEAFDKTAKLLGLPYPGGPQLDKSSQGGNPQKYTFPSVDTPGLNYSFSGIKTAFMYFLRDQMAKNEQFIAQNITDICASIQASIVEILLKKLRKAAKETGIKEIAIAGGVSANSWLRAKLQEEAVKHRWTVHVPAFEYCTDNAAMIAMAAHYKYEQQEFVNLQAGPLPRLAL
ncbi:MAG: tRNA ((37)-N6)-threonylcarbamoyltransferase complex transferase subunit TsaD [Bacteroidota bacterium]|jgi:N6-L-threonylcarbamoyladenine synthase